MKDPEGAKFLYRMAKSARKHWAGLAAVTQDADDVLATDLGRAIIANAATQVLLRQAPQAIEQVAAEFRLSAGERQLLLSARRGEGLLACRAVRPGVVPGPGLTRRALPVHQRPGRDRRASRPASPATPPARRLPGDGPGAEDDLLP